MGRDFSHGQEYEGVLVINPFEESQDAAYRKPQGPRTRPALRDGSCREGSSVLDPYEEKNSDGQQGCR